MPTSISPSGPTRKWKWAAIASAETSMWSARCCGGARSPRPATGFQLTFQESAMKILMPAALIATLAFGVLRADEGGVPNEHASDVAKDATSKEHGKPAEPASDKAKE